MEPVFSFFRKCQKVSDECKAIINDHAQELGLKILGYRAIPVNEKVPGSGAKPVEPLIEQIFVQAEQDLSVDELERKLFVLRNYSTHYIGHNVQGNNKAFYVCSLSTSTVIYKGQLRTNQLREYFDDLRDERFKSAFAIIHSRFSTKHLPELEISSAFPIYSA